MWHQRLGHMSEKGMKIMHSKGKLPGLESVGIDMCEDCIFGKQKRVSFQTSGRTPKKERLELVHSDVWGPTTISSIGGKHYFVTFIDDHSRKVWVYFLKHKSEVFEVFKRWKAMVENETGLKIKRLRTDNGGEYEDTRFKKFCYEQGIRMERTVPGTPQHNGVAERMNRTLTERARSIRIQSGLPKQFWAEAVNTAAYLINRGPSVPLEHRIPEEVWSGKEIKLSHLKVFGCVAYVHISDQGRNKLDPKSKKCTFIGYGEDEFGYRIWDNENKKVIRSRDVIFNERMMYKDRHKNDTSNTEQSVPIFVDTDDVPDSLVTEPMVASPQLEELVGQSSAQQSDTLQPSTPAPVLRRSSRPHVPNRRYMNYLLLTDGGEPECYDEACQTGDASKWELAMKDEMRSLISNQTWELAELPVGKKALHNKWVYRVKEEHDGSKRYKARLVVKGFQQKEGVDYTDIFAPVVKLNTIRSVLSIVAIEDLYLEQLDVKTAFLHGDLDEEIYMHQPEGFSERGNKNMVCRLKKSLYGLKQAPRQWYKKFDSFMHKEGFQKCNADHCCYFKRYRSSYIILLLYVDDMLVAGSDMDDIRRLKQQLSKEFDMKDLGPAKKILGMQITRDKHRGILQLSQTEYINRVLQRFNMGDAKPVSTPLASHFHLSKDQSPQTEEERDLMAKVPYASAIGSLMYAMVCTRPDIGHAVGVVSRFMSNPGKAHWEAVKWILRYLQGTSEKCLYFGKGELKVQGYVDADFGGEVDHRRSTTGYIFTVGNTAVSWMSQLQKIVTLSTTEAEYVAVTEASKEMIWLQGLLTELGFKQEKNVLHSDSQSAIHLAKNSAFHSRTKHIGLRYHFIRSLLEDEVLTLEKIQGSKNPADMLTKTVTIDKLKLCSTSVGLQE
ncbi:Toll-Interleukin-Resistance domain family protein [Prunus dulcis]|uniref:Toll-Interleukin-Resistance domain family protein n=3 Tax=Prunus dulcis TaxID=3755 RepID=A0A4Y1RID3_PRUDU|nr:Toll-Interleukin-Resistance domain family protein [Prunus dulcis]